MLTIRLSRTGKKGQPSYRLIVSEKARDPWGKYLELLGNFNPRTKELNAKKDRIEHWISKGAQMSPTANNILLKAGIVTGKKQKSVNISKARAAKMNKVKEDAKAKAEAEIAKKAAAEEAAKAETEKPAEAPEEKPAEEIPAEPVAAEEEIKAE